jgi:hypothetical protein
MGLADDLAAIQPARKTIISQVEIVMAALSGDDRIELEKALSNPHLSANDIARALVRNGHLTHLSDPAQSVRKYRQRVLVDEPR